MVISFLALDVHSVLRSASDSWRKGTAVPRHRHCQSDANSECGAEAMVSHTNTHGTGSSADSSAATQLATRSVWPNGARGTREGVGKVAL